jgi:hypothetical protein
MIAWLDRVYRWRTKQGTADGNYILLKVETGQCQNLSATASSAFIGMRNRPFSSLPSSLIG